MRNMDLAHFVAPAEYGKLVLEHTPANIATLTTVAELTSLWSS